MGCKSRHGRSESLLSPDRSANPSTTRPRADPWESERLCSRPAQAEPPSWDHQNPGPSENSERERCDYVLRWLWSAPVPVPRAEQWPAGQLLPTAGPFEIRWNLEPQEIVRLRRS